MNLTNIAEIFNALTETHPIKFGDGDQTKYHTEYLGIPVEIRSVHRMSRAVIFDSEDMTITFKATSLEQFGSGIDPIQFTEWLAETVPGVPAPIWEKTLSEVTAERIEAMTLDEIKAELVSVLNGKRSGWNRVAGYRSVAALPDGTIEANGQGEEGVARAILMAVLAEKHKRSESATKAAKTKARRRERLVHQYAGKVLVEAD